MTERGQEGRLTQRELNRLVESDRRAAGAGVFAEKLKQQIGRVYPEIPLETAIEMLAHHVHTNKNRLASWTNAEIILHTARLPTLDQMGRLCDALNVDPFHRATSESDPELWPLWTIDLFLEIFSRDEVSEEFKQKMREKEWGKGEWAFADEFFATGNIDMTAYQELIDSLKPQTRRTTGRSGEVVHVRSPTDNAMLAELSADAKTRQQQIDAAVSILRKVSPAYRGNAMTWIEKFNVRDEKILSALQYLAKNDPDDSLRDRAQKFLDNNVGGIDLNPAALDLEIDQAGTGKVKLDLQLLEDTLKNVHIEGLSPVILQITPVTDLPFLLGTNQKRPEVQVSQL